MTQQHAGLVAVNAAATTIRHTTPVHHTTPKPVQSVAAVSKAQTSTPTCTSSVVNQHVPTPVAVQGNMYSTKQVHQMIRVREQVMQLRFFFTKLTDRATDQSPEVGNAVQQLIQDLKVGDWAFAPWGSDFECQMEQNVHHYFLFLTEIVVHILFHLTLDVVV